MTRLLAWVALLSLLLGAALGFFLGSRTSHGSGEVVGPPSVDSSRVVAVRDSLDRERAAHAHDLDSLRARLARHPETAWKTALQLVRDTVNVGRIDTQR